MVENPQFADDSESVQTLADLLAAGPLQLGSALRCASDIAAELRDLHQQTKAYGKLHAGSIVLTENGAHLIPLRTYWDQAVPERDIQAFGAVFYQMLTGTVPPSTLTPTDIRMPGPRTGAARLRASCMRLALKCAAPKGTRLSIQQVTTEIRLLSVLQRQEEANERPAQENSAVAVLTATPTPAQASAAPPNALSVAAPAADTKPAEAALRPAVPLVLESFGQPTPKVPAALQPAGGNCPKCDSTAVYVSRGRSGFEQMLERWNVPICRCHRCYHRYVVFARLKISKDMPVGTQRKFKPRKRNS